MKIVSRGEVAERLQCMSDWGFSDTLYTRYKADTAGKLLMSPIHMVRKGKKLPCSHELLTERDRQMFYVILIELRYFSGLHYIYGHTRPLNKEVNSDEIHPQNNNFREIAQDTRHCFFSKNKGLPSIHVTDS